MPARLSFVRNDFEKVFVRHLKTVPPGLTSTNTHLDARGAVGRIDTLLWHFYILIILKLALQFILGSIFISFKEGQVYGYHSYIFNW
jgi:hypothetical protein